MIQQSQTYIDQNEEDRRALILMLALTPCLMMGIYIFGVNMLILALAASASAAVFQWIFDKATKRKALLPDYTAMVTGLILAFSLPARLPVWIAVIGSFIAIVIVKGILGGFGEKTACPAIAANVVLQLVFRTQMNEWPLNDFVKTSADEPGAVDGATPLGMLAEGKDLPGLLRMFIGFVSGPCGAVSIAAILIGGLYLVWKRIISPVVPAGVIAAVFVFALVYYSAAGEAAAGLTEGEPESAIHMAMFHVLAGSAAFFSVFGAALYGETIKDRIGGLPGDSRPSGALETEKPARKLAVILTAYAAGVGVITMIIRLWGPFEDGAATAVLIMDIAAYLVIRYADSKNKMKQETK